jgi:putative alpha-1,2-mannosidase
MIGCHAVPVIVDGFLKGVKGFDKEHAYQAIKTTAMNPDYDSLSAYSRLGWVPCDQENESVSKTLEYAYDDYCAAQMAKALGKVEDHQYFMRRAGNFTNLYDPSIGLMRPKDSHGQWRTPFNPHFYDDDSRTNDFTEGTSWQYSWYAPQDVPRLIALAGGKEPFALKLDQLFTFHQADTNKGMDDVRRILARQRTEPPHYLSLLLRRPAVESGPTFARSRPHAIRQQARFPQRQR